MMGLKIQYLARAYKLKSLSRNKKALIVKKKSATKMFPRRRKVQEISQHNGIDEQEGKLPPSTAADKKDGSENTIEFSQHNRIDEQSGKLPESVAAHEENRNENIPEFVVENKVPLEELPRAQPTKKKRVEQWPDLNESKIAMEFPEIEQDNEVLPEFVVYDEIPAQNLEADGAMEHNEAITSSWVVGDQNELAGIKRMCLPQSKLTLDEIVIPDDWCGAVEFITNNEWPKQSADGDCSAVPPIVVVCGAQNVGKTTFARFLVNNLLRRYNKVGYLDTDVGQPEFTPPGCLSLHIIEKPNPDLSILCLRTPDRCYFYGDISAKSHPESYLHIIVNLYDHFRKEYYDVETSDESEVLKRVQIPLVVNTHGWVKGLGYDVLVDMVRYMVPTHVVQIRLSAVSKNLPLGTFWSSGRDYKSSTKLVYLGTAMKDIMDKSVVIQKHGRQMRELRIIAYFRQCFGGTSKNIKTYKELAHALASHSPYQVSMQRIKVVHLHCQVPDSEIYYSLNGTIVGLAVDSKNCPQTFSQPVCVGLGIVRGVDIFKGLFYVITPVPLRTLQNVDTFLQGFIEIPVSILQTQGLICPYMSANAISREGTGAASILGGKQRDRKMDRIVVPQ